MIAAPEVVLRAGCNLCPYWIIMDVFNARKDMAVSGDEITFESPLPDVPCVAVFSSKLKAVGERNCLHYLGDSYVVRGLNDQVRMVIHKHQGV